MTDSTGQKITWLEYQASKLGVTQDEVRQIMSERSKKADKSGSGFASMTPERRAEVAKRGGKAGLGKGDGKS
jgi:hypothetical protein